jgi:hypothetical protein
MEVIQREVYVPPNSLISTSFIQQKKVIYQITYQFKKTILKRTIILDLFIGMSDDIERD